MINRITVGLEQKEYSALLKAAVAELRNPNDQVRHIVRQELERRGLLNADTDGQGQFESERWDAPIVEFKLESINATGTDDDVRCTQGSATGWIIRWRVHRTPANRLTKENIADE
jgi:hypothetical protein